jgi:hypothetical protein
MVVEWAIRYDAALQAPVATRPILARVATPTAGIEIKEPGETDWDILYKEVIVVDDYKPDVHDHIDNVSALPLNDVFDSTPEYIIGSAPKDVFDFSPNGPSEAPPAQQRQRRVSNSSDVSETSSLASIADSIFSIASASSMSSIMSTHGAGDRLMTLLREDSILKPLYQEAITKVASEKLERNLRRLFNRFAVDLREEAVNPQQRGAAHFVRSRARNSAHVICGALKCGPKSTPTSLPTIDIPQEIVEDVSDNSTDPDSQEDEPDDLRELEAFIITSRAFEALRLNLRLFIYPEESNVPVTDETLISAVVEQSTDETPSGGPLEIVVKDVVVDLAHLNFMDAERECPFLESPMVAKKFGESSQSCPVEPKSENWEKLLSLFISVTISLIYPYFILGIILNLYSWDLPRDIFEFSKCTRNGGAAETAEALITWPPISFPEGFISCLSDFGGTQLLEYYLGFASIVLGFAALRFFADGPLARLVNRRFSQKGRTFTIRNKSSGDVPFETLKFNGVDCAKFLPMVLEETNRNRSDFSSTLKRFIFPRAD